MNAVAKATLLSLALFVGAGVLDYAFVLAMSWLLPPEAYGALGVASTWFLLLSFFVASGFPMALSKFLSERPEAPMGLVRFALRANVLVALAVVALFLGATFYGPLSPGPGYGRLVWAVAVAVMLLSVGGTLQFALQGRMSFRAFAMLHASKSLSKLAVGVALVMLGLGVAGGLAGLAVGGGFLAVVAWIVLLRQHPETLKAGTLDPAEKRRFLRYTLSVFAGSFALTVMMSLDLLAVKYLSPREQSDLLAAQYQTATLLTKAPLWLVLAALSVLFPVLSRAAKRDPAAASRLLRDVLRGLTLVFAPLAALLALFPAQVLGLLFPATYVGAAPILAVSALGMVALALALVLTRALQATDRARLAGASLVMSLALQAALLAALVPARGAIGAAVATASASAAGAALVLVAAARPFRLRVGARDALALLVSVALAAATFAALRPAGRVATLAALGAAGLAYAAGVWSLGLVRRRERARVLRMLRLGEPEPDLDPMEA